MNDNHIEDFVEGNIIIGSVKKSILEEQIVSAMILKTIPNELKGIEILQFATVKVHSDDFRLLTKYVIKNYLINRVILYSDNCTAETIPYEKYGFITTQHTSPDYKYLIGNKRVDKANLTGEQSTNLDGLNRIWDAGKTKWKYLF